MSERKMWEEKQDNMIRKIVKQNESRSQTEKWKWSEIAEILQKRISGCRRSGKQCRQRWYNHLDPAIIKDKELSRPEIDKLFDLQSKLGNRWANIAKQFPGRTDNNLKNFFYSSLRRAIRQINFFVAHYKKKSNIKPFKQTILAKILNISDQKYRQKLDIKSQKADELARNVKDMLAELSLQEQEKQLNQQDINFRQKLVKGIQQFNKNCKKRKSKRVQQNEQPDLEQLSQYNQNHYNDSCSDSVKIPKQKTAGSRKSKGNLQNGEHGNTKQKNKIKGEQNLNDFPKPLFQNPIDDIKGSKKALRKKKSQIELLQQYNVDRQPFLDNKKSSSKLDSRSSGKDGFKYESSDLFRRSSISAIDNEPLRMLTRQSSCDDKEYPNFINGLEPWKKNQSKIQSGLFQSYIQHDLDPLLLQSLNIGDTLPKVNENSINQSGFLKLFKGESSKNEPNNN